VELASVRGERRMRLEDFISGPKRNGLAEDELIAAVWVPRAGGPQQFAKVGTRNAMVIAVCSFALALDEGRVGTCIGSAAPTPRRAREAEAYAAEVLDWAGGAPLEDEVAARFGALVASAASPIDDVRGSAAYRSHALGVLAQRTLRWAWEERCG
jgi:CO/xanthine dehydrogenase FAD-binding subunit